MERRTFLKGLAIGVVGATIPWSLPDERNQREGYKTSGVPKDSDVFLNGCLMCPKNDYERGWFNRIHWKVPVKKNDVIVIVSGQCHYTHSVFGGFISVYKKKVITVS